MKKYGRVMGYFDGPFPDLWTTDADIIKSVFVKISTTSLIVGYILFVLKNPRLYSNGCYLENLK